MELLNTGFYRYTCVFIGAGFSEIVGVKQESRTMQLLPSGSFRKIDQAVVWPGGFVALSEDFTIFVCDLQMKRVRK